MKNVWVVQRMAPFMGGQIVLVTADKDQAAQLASTSLYYIAQKFTLGEVRKPK